MAYKAYNVSMRVIAVTFVTTPQQANPQLTFPKKIAALLGLPRKAPKRVALVIRKVSGEILFAGEPPLRSGTEIYGATDIKPALSKLKRGEQIWVEAWRPKPK